MKFKCAINKYLNKMIVLGILLLLISTFLYTNIIKNIDLEINEIDYKINKFERGSQISLILQNYYSIQKTRRHLYLSDLALFNYIKINGETIKKAKSDIFEISKSLIVEYAVLHAGYSGKDVESTRKEAENKAIEVIRSDLKDSEKIDKLNRILDEYLIGFISSFVKKQDIYHSNISFKDKLMEKRNNWENIFLWIQIIGIILISVAGLTGKILDKNN